MAMQVENLCDQTQSAFTLTDNTGRKLQRQAFDGIISRSMIAA
jgi:hypothetical protein